MFPWECHYAVRVCALNEYYSLSIAATAWHMCTRMEKDQA